MSNNSLKVHEQTEYDSGNIETTNHVLFYLPEFNQKMFASSRTISLRVRI
jgi:hypothetical protein